MIKKRKIPWDGEVGMDEIRIRTERQESKARVILQFPEASIPGGTAQIEEDVREILRAELLRRVKSEREVVWRAEGADVTAGQLQPAAGGGR
ncbi:MAG: hypothetical protein NC432_10285 [Roseburia sp.]|nr:hypothetical protein [Roseburia sp.]MCM1097283.1 hypothetical protein [Ruminococcus flavefaciens]